MTFDELQKIVEEKFGIIRLADIARELDVTPQVVSNWKARNQVPYKYIKVLRKRVNEIDQSNIEVPAAGDQGTTVTGYPPGAFQQDEQSFTENIIFLYQVLRDNIVIFLVSPVIFLGITLLNLKFFTEPVYTSTAKIMPISDIGGNSQLQGVAQQFGLSMGPEQVSSLSSAIMFPEILKSRRLARELLGLRFHTKKFGLERPLINIIKNTNNESKNWSEKSKKKVVRKLLKMISVSKNKKSPLITLEVNAFEAQFSADLAAAVIDNLEKIAIHFKLSRVKEKKLFIENRISEIDLDLRKAEENLKIFRERNRSINSSPALLLEQERLLLEAEVQKQMFITLKSQYEMVQIEEVEKGSMIQVLDPPEAPTSKTLPKPKRDILMGILLGVIFGGCLTFLKEWYKNNKGNFIFS